MLYHYLLNLKAISKEKPLLLSRRLAPLKKLFFYVEAGKKALEDLGLIVEELDVAAENLEEITMTLKKK